MTHIVIGSIVISLLHAVIPNHWLPILAIGRKQKWSLQGTLLVTTLAALAHVVSTITIGLLIGTFGVQLDNRMNDLMHWVAPSVLIVMGFFFIWQHYRHKHFHLKADIKNGSSKKIIIGLIVAMFFSPCLEIGALYFSASPLGWSALLMISAIYFVLTVLGMVAWVAFAYRGLKKWNWHSLEHNAGIISGLTLMIIGVLMFLLH